MLYKYSAEQYLSALCDRGHIRVGTLYEYRDIEKYGKVIGDGDEGTKAAMVSEPFVAHSQSDLAPVLQAGIRLGPGSSIISRGRITVKSTSTNCLVFCMSSTLSRKLSDDFKSDGCYVQITDVPLFLRHITDRLKQVGDFLDVQIAPCIYRPRLVDHRQEDFAHPVRIKDPMYEYQAEVRAVWFPKDKDVKLSPVTFDCPDLMKVCRFGKFK